MIGGSDIQAPHNDGRGGKNCKGVSVIFAIDDNTYLCIYDRSSIKDSGNGKKSIEYRKVFVPKGRAIFFNSFSCLHGGFKYENGYISSPICVDGGRHIRIFFRFVDASTMIDSNDFYLLPDVNEYIEVTNSWKHFYCIMLYYFNVFIVICNSDGNICCIILYYCNLKHHEL